MDSKGEANGTTQYSPLNNLSSGDEVEQFALPVSVNVHKPKRRRKRKEFDLLKAQGMGGPPSAGLCRTSTCLFTFVLILLTALVCGLSVLVYQLYTQVGELQRQVSGVEGQAASHASSLGALMSKLEQAQTNISALRLDSHTVNASVNAALRDLGAVTARVTALEKSRSQQPEPAAADQLSALQRNLAQFGSDISSLQTDMASVKQSQLSADARIADLDKLVSDSASRPPAGADAGPQLANLSNTIQMVNQTVSAQINSLNGLLSQSYVNHTRLDSRLNSLYTRMEARVLQLEQDVSVMNSTLEDVTAAVSSGGQPDGQASGVVPAGPSDDGGFIELTNRVDVLEASVREIALRQSDAIVAQTENQVVNMTITKGMEDIINRVIKQSVSSISDKVTEVSRHSSLVEARIIVLEQNFQALSAHLSALTHMVASADSSAESSDPVNTTEPIPRPRDRSPGDRSPGALTTPATLQSTEAEPISPASAKVDASPATTAEEIVMPSTTSTTSTTSTSSSNQANGSDLPGANTSTPSLSDLLADPRGR